jgi:hypothetical protein
LTHQTNAELFFGFGLWLWAELRRKVRETSWVGTPP